MHTVLGATGQVGGIVAEELLAAGHSVRAIVRVPLLGQFLKDQGAELAVADATLSVTLRRAFDGAEAAFVLNPPASESPDLFRVSADVCRALRSALAASGVPRVVVLSSIGAHLDSGTGIVATDHLLEAALYDCAPRVTIVRSAWFMENWAAGVWPAKTKGLLPSMLAPVERAIPQISVVDVGRICAQAMQGGPPGTTIVEAEGPREYSPQDVAQVLSGVLGRKVEAVPLAEEQWEDVFCETGDSRRTALARIQAVRAINEGSLTFEGGHRRVLGRRTLEGVCCGPGPRPAEALGAVV